MFDLIQKLQIDTVNYREAIDNLFSSALITARCWQVCFLQILISCSELYTDYLKVIMRHSELAAVSSRRGGLKRLRCDSVRFMELRKRLAERLNTSDCWTYFSPTNAFSEDTGLRTLDDYIGAFSLHLPEIYEETFRVEVCARSFLENQNSSALVQLVVGLEHLGRNHISFVLQPLEWVTDEGSWNSSNPCS